ncbi:MAG: SAM-dependent chlorinase/fluorinase [Oscillatoriales cyanobacterium C42_A2020_001]|nr:SAM-dependent chlorinase/fluorinase [Leptolyngbyaceae cyanobacterium C42_A2020_001]
MSRSGILTLLTDFGTRDSYVGVMKGAIAQVNPCLTVIDLTHDVPPQNIAHARFALMSAVPYFPRGTVHIAVVDPGVGSDRRGVAIAFGDSATQPTGFLVGPDNGLFSGVLAQYPVLAAVELTNPQYWRESQPSSTFHGRDIFAPVGAHLASGISLEVIGSAIAPDTLTSFPLPLLTRQNHSILGCIQAIDHFGNLITNIHSNDVADFAWAVQIADLSIDRVTAYRDRPSSSPLALIGSHGWVEIAINCGNAQQMLNLHIGDPIQIVLEQRKE